LGEVEVLSARVIRKEFLCVGCGKGEKLGRGDRCNTYRGAADADPLRAAEEEQLVFENWAADGEAKLIAGVLPLGQTLLGIEDSVRRVSGETVELPDHSMKCVGSALRRHVDDSAGGTTVLGFVVTGLDAKFLGSILRNVDTDVIR